MLFTAVYVITLNSLHILRSMQASNKAVLLVIANGALVIFSIIHG